MSVTILGPAAADLAAIRTGTAGTQNALGFGQAENYLLNYLNNYCQYWPMFPKRGQPRPYPAPLSKKPRHPAGRAVSVHNGQLEVQFRIVRRNTPQGAEVEVLGYDWL